MVDVDATLAEQGALLATAIEEALPRWSARVVVERGGPGLAAAGEAAGRAAAEQLGPELRSLLAADVDEQRTNPLTIVRRAVDWPAQVLREAGVPVAHRDEHDRAHFPDDDYGLTPMSFAEVDAALHELGIRWGALKARAHLVRHAR